MNSVTKHLIMPGETAKEMMMKANFKDERVRNAFLRSHQRYTEFHQKKHLETALEYIALSDTINAKGKSGCRKPLSDALPMIYPVVSLPRRCKWANMTKTEYKRKDKWALGLWPLLVRKVPGKLSI